MKTVSVVANVQIERAAAFPPKLADNPFRAVALDTLQRHNAMLDAVLYDVDVIHEDETPELAFWLAREGSVIWCLRPEVTGSRFPHSLPKRNHADQGVPTCRVRGSSNTAVLSS
ncbi:hypothetical protein EBB04_33150 [Sinorhizobium meliloti]|nr:hypothetical protein EBB04_33150 [Sinorhizobium meliloti]